ncbi:unnamed protein product [Ectocarpus sp. CCAP 1310/34]|nr:unnamed protein product [Ectocarpus sp. CCAP 1310/34]
MLDRYRERIELGQVTCGRLEVRDLSSAMLDAAQEVEKHEQDWRPAFLKRQSNRGVCVGDVGFVEGTQDDIDKAQDLRRERCRISEEKHAAGDHTRPEKYRDINMLYFEGEGDDRKFSTYYKFEYGKNKEGYWTGEKMIEHMADVLDLLAVKFPRHRPICFFDWSSCHDCVEEGAPSVTRMNAGYGGVRKGQEIAPQNATTILEDTPKLKVGAVQHLTFQQGEYPFYEPGATDHVGKVKGMKQILFERGLWIPGMTMSGGKTGQEPNKKMSMPAVLRAQKDFANVDSSLEVLLKRHGGVALMLPKFHCELNPIELVWGRSKWWVRRNCKYTIACLRENVSKSYGVHNLSLDIVQKFCRKVANFHAVYDAGLTGAEAVEAQEKCKSHRKPAPSEYINPK